MLASRAWANTSQKGPACSETYHDDVESYRFRWESLPEERFVADVAAAGVLFFPAAESTPGIVAAAASLTDFIRKAAKTPVFP
jgi:hypothetical protein